MKITIQSPQTLTGIKFRNDHKTWSRKARRITV